MPRHARAWEPGSILNIVCRAHEGRDLFVTDEDREFLLERIEQAFRETGTICLAWAIMINHVHLTIQVGASDPAAAMARINTAVCLRQRRRRGGRGHVLQDRYFSSFCTSETSAVEMMTYTLGNPVKHHVLADLSQLASYRWSGYGELLGLRPARLINVPRALALFHPDATVARDALAAAMENRVRRWERGEDDAEPTRLTRRAATELGLRRAPAAVVGALEAAAGCLETRTSRRYRLRRLGWTPDRLIAPVAERFGASADLVRTGRRTRPESHARAVICFVACDCAGTRASEMAILTGVAESSVVDARRRGLRLLGERGWTAEELLDASLEALRDGGVA
jgi:REP element-mobilizing transposase RayT